MTDISGLVSVATMTHPTANGQVSFWWSQTERTARPPLPGPLDADVCIVGGGYTGLWTTYYLKQHEPGLRIAVLEARFAGFGASGRNGGWLTNSVTGGLEQYVERHGREGARRQQVAANESVDEVIRVAADEGIDAGIRRGGELLVARNPAQLARAHAEAATAEEWPETGWVGLDATQVTDRIGIPGTLGGAWQPHCAVLQPAALAAGLARAVERLGVEIFEDTTALAIEPGLVRTPHGDVTARHVIRATEGFTADVRGQHRTWLPMNSSLIVTDPLPDRTWDQIGWTESEALGDTAHVYIYAQRTADGRIAIGGRGVPYLFGSRTDADGRTPQTTIDSLTSLLHDFFPATRGTRIAHAWSGVLGVPRDWSATVAYDRATGLGHAGGYVGTGVTSTNLAGRTLADLVLERDSDLVTLPWVGHRARKWEVEPLRYLGVSAIYGAYRRADAVESRGITSTSRWARMADVIAGR